MFTLPHNTIVYLYKESIDMRMGMFRLQSIIVEQHYRSFYDGGIFLFINQPHTLLSAVWFDGTGLCIFSKRLEEGLFSWPKSVRHSEEKWLQIQPSTLTLLLDGIELKKCMKKAWYEV